MRAANDKLVRTVLLVLILLFLGLFYTYYTITKPQAELVSDKRLRAVVDIYAYGTGPDQFLKRPSDVAFDSKGLVYVADTGNSRVLVFDQAGRFVRKIGASGSGRGRFKTPMGITVADDGRVCVADQTRDRVVVFRPNGRVLREIKVESPTKALVHAGRLYVANHRSVSVYNLNTGHRLMGFGRAGRGDGEFHTVAGLAVDEAGTIFVSDLNNLRVQAFDKSGNWQWSIGSPPKDLDGAGRRFGLPAGLTVDSAGRLYVVDAFNHRIEVFTKDRDSLMYFGKKGRLEGEFYFPQGLAYWKDDIFAIADKHNDRVQIFRINVPDLPPEDEN